MIFECTYGKRKFYMPLLRGMPCLYDYTKDDFIVFGLFRCKEVDLELYRIYHRPRGVRIQRRRFAMYIDDAIYFVRGMKSIKVGFSGYPLEPGSRGSYILRRITGYEVVDYGKCRGALL